MRFSLDLCVWFGCAHPRIILGVGPVTDLFPLYRPSPSHGSRRGPKRGELLMALTMTDAQHTNMTVKSVKDKRGNDVTANLDGPPEWSTDNPNVLALTPADDGLSCDVAAVGPLGNAGVTLNVSAGGVALTGHVDVTIKASAPTTVDIDPGTPADIP